MSRRYRAFKLAPLPLVAAWLLIVGAFVVLGPPEARADRRTEARRHFREAMRLVDVGQPLQAIDELKQAQAALPHANVLFNIAQLYAEQGMVSEAIDYFQQYLASSPEDAERVEALVASLREKLPSLIAPVDVLDAASDGTSPNGSAPGGASNLLPLSMIDLSPIGRSRVLLESLARTTDSASLRSAARDLSKLELDIQRLEQARLARAREAEAEDARGKRAPRLDDNAPAEVGNGARIGVRSGARSGARPVGQGREDEDGATSASKALEGSREDSREGSREGSIGASPPPSGMAAATQVERPQQAASGAGTSTVANAGPTLEDNVYDAQLVSASRYVQSPLDAPSATHIITREEIRSSGLSSIPELLRRVPGADVMTASPSDLNVSLRGFNQRLSNRLLVLVDGRSVYTDMLGTTFWHSLTIGPEDIERIEIIRGPASALYGADAFSGVVNIITRRPGEDPGVEVFASAGSHEWLHEHASTSGQAGRLAYRFAAGLDNALRFSQEVSDQRVDIARNFKAQDQSWRVVRANSALAYRLAPELGLVVRGGASHGRVEWQATSGLRDFGMDLNLNAFASAQLDSKHGLLRVFYHHFDASGGPQYVRLGENPYLFDATTNTLDVEGIFSKRFDFLVPHNFQIGGAYRRKQVGWNYLDRDHAEDHFAVFMQDNLRLTGALSFQGSIRADFHPLLSKPPISPRGALIYRPSAESAVRLAAGSAFRTPSFLESYVNVGANLEIPGATPAVTGTTQGAELGGNNLNPESILSVELSYANFASSSFDFEVVGYYNHVTDLAPIPSPDPSENPTVADIASGATAEFDPFLGVFSQGFAPYRNQDTAYHALGTELSTRIYPIQGLDVYANYALEKIMTGAGQVSEYKFDERTSVHKLNLGARYRFDMGLALSADVHFASRQLWTELTADGSAETREVPAYYLANARVSYSFLEDQAEVAVTGYNVTNNEHRQHPYGQRLGARVLGSLALKL
ncbi:MAG: TonB-dependent receptor [Deltaproteobacteria bacterium]|nr:TonB-dependent receptor [Deltaproteobacteria bacterium]